MEYLYDVVNDYFAAFQAKNLDKLKVMYDENVVLNEWYHSIYKGAESVLDANKQLFDSFDVIEVNIAKMASYENSVLCELEILLDGDLVRVVDVITVDDFTGKIIEVTAYKGFN